LNANSPTTDANKDPMQRLSPFLFVAVLACAKPASTPVTASPAAGAPPMPGAIVWSRASAEHKALFLQTYHAAEAELEQRARALQRGTWAVILDADETVLDNSVYQQERAQLGLPYTSESWNAWVRRIAATALPGAASFTKRVHDLGGRVVIVTNRDAAVCPETRENLRRVEISADLVLCAPPGQSDKNIRFRAVEAGTSTASVPALQVVMYVGDNIQDFPNLGQNTRFADDSAFTEFGRRYFLLPNPMYGSWERNPIP
jgi:5'-nucleotidase (lipoprotein e(P4) family)